MDFQETEVLGMSIIYCIGLTWKRQVCTSNGKASKVIAQMNVIRAAKTYKTSLFWLTHKPWGPFIYYVSTFFEPPSQFINVSLVLKVRKNCNFLTPSPHKCLRNIWMVPCNLSRTSNDLNSFKLSTSTSGNHTWKLKKYYLIQYTGESQF